MIDILKISLIAYMFTALGQEEGQIFYWYQKQIKKLPKYLYYPLGGCFMCFTGQVCLWYYLFWHFVDYNFIDHLFYASAGIFLSIIYNYLYKLL